MHTESNHLNSNKDTLWYVQCILFGGLILYFGRSLFVPLSFAILISFVLYPICRWLESKGVMRMGAIALALLLLLALGTGLVGIVKLVADHNPRWKTISMIVGTERPT